MREIPEWKQNQLWADCTPLLEDMRDVDHGYIYRLYDVPGVIIYVGQTRGLLAVRLAAHAADKSWWPEVAEVKAKRIKAAKLDRAERAEIRLWQPKHNQVRYGAPLADTHSPEKVAAYKALGSQVNY